MREKLGSSKNLSETPLEAAALPALPLSEQNRILIRKIRQYESELRELVLTEPASAPCILALMGALDRGRIQPGELFARLGSEKITKSDGTVEQASQKTNARSRLLKLRRQFLGMRDGTEAVCGDLKEGKGGEVRAGFLEWRTQILNAELSPLAYRLIVDALRDESSARAPIPNASTDPEISSVLARHPLPIGFRERAGIISDQIGRITGKVAELNLGLVERLVRAFGQSTVEREDMRQEARIGLISAIEAYDPDLGRAFSTFANYKIAAKIFKSIESRGIGQVRLPSPIYHGVQQVRKLEARHEGLCLSPSEISKMLGVEKGAAAVIRDLASGFSFSINNRKDEQYDFQEKFAGPDPSDGGALYDEGLRYSIERSLERLRPQQRLILNYLYIAELSYRETAELCGFSAQRVRQIERKALARLRLGRNRELLIDYAARRPDAESRSERVDDSTGESNQSSPS